MDSMIRLHVEGVLAAIRAGILLTNPRSGESATGRHQSCMALEPDQIFLLWSFQVLIAHIINVMAWQGSASSNAIEICSRKQLRMYLRLVAYVD